jgi:hypothetical protein
MNIDLENRKQKWIPFFFSAAAKANGSRGERTHIGTAKDGMGPSCLAFLIPNVQICCRFSVHRSLTKNPPGGPQGC